MLSAKRTAESSGWDFDSALWRGEKCGPVVGWGWALAMRVTDLGGARLDHLPARWVGRRGFDRSAPLRTLGGVGTAGAVCGGGGAGGVGGACPGGSVVAAAAAAGGSMAGGGVTGPVGAVAIVGVGRVGVAGRSGARFAKLVRFIPGGRVVGVGGCGVPSARCAPRAVERRLAAAMIAAAAVSALGRMGGSSPGSVPASTCRTYGRCVGG